MIVTPPAFTRLPIICPLCHWPLHVRSTQLCPNVAHLSGPPSPATCPRCGDPLNTTPCSTCEAIQNGSFGAE